MRIAWFSPLPPSTSGIAAYSAELLPLLAARECHVSTFSEINGQDFVWMHRRNPFDLTVFHLGNASCHDYMWAYMFRYPGVVVLHDAQLHQARALSLTKRWQPRRDDYLAEFRANHPEAPENLGELIALGRGGTLYQHWPLIGLVIEAARMIVVHNPRLAQELVLAHPGARIEAIEMGVADPLSATGLSAEALNDPAGAKADAMGADVRRRHGVPQDAVLLTAFGGVTPEKRIPQLLRAVGEIAGRRPQLHVMCVGNAVDHYDVLEDARVWRVAERVHVTGYVPDQLLPHYLAAADLCACLRWPTNRETSASWLRCLAAARATMITELADLVDVPTLDPRGWRVKDVVPHPREPVAVSIDLVDEDHSLPLALERLAADTALRERLGVAARSWWAARHQLEPMADAYRRLLVAALAAPVPRIDLPPHLLDEGTQRLRALADEVGVSTLVSEIV